MTGHQVTDRPGYDMHGLPIEVKVEEELGFTSKRDIEEFGMEQFIQKCKEFAVRNREAMDEDFQSIGAWMDWDNPYQTLSPEYMESAWWAFSKVAKRTRRTGQAQRQLLPALSDRHRGQRGRVRRNHLAVHLRQIPPEGPQGQPRHLDDDAVDHPREHVRRRRR